MSGQQLAEARSSGEEPTSAPPLESTVASLVQELALVRARLDALEAQQRGEPASTASEVVATGSEPAPTAEPDPAQPPPEIPFTLPSWASGFAAVSLVGRTLMALGGGYLLRSVTDAGMIPAFAGAAAGLVYALVWLFVADRAAAVDRKQSSIFHALAAVLIAYPLLLESTVRFQLIGTWGAALLIVVVLGLGLLVAHRHALAPIAWVNVLFAVATSLIILLSTPDIMPFALNALAIVVVVEVLTFSGLWKALRWPATMGMAIVGLIMTSIATRAEGLPEGYEPLEPMVLIVLGLGMACVYIISTTLRALLDDRRVEGSDGLLTALALLVGLGGALRITHFLEESLLGIGLLCLIVGAAAYGFGLTRYVRRSAERPGEFYYFTSLAAALMLAGLGVCFSGGVLAIALLVFSAAAFVVAQHYDRMTLRHHAFVFLLGGAISGGLTSGVTDSFLMSGSVAWRPISPVCYLALFVALGGYLLQATWRPNDMQKWPDRVPHAMTAAVAGWIIVCLGARIASSLLADAPGPDADVAILATVRTSMLALVSVAMAWVGHHWRRRELVWLVYVVLAVGAFKLIAEDFRHGRPTTLFATLVLFGGALILVARIVRMDRSGPHEPPTLPDANLNPPPPAALSPAGSHHASSARASATASREDASAPALPAREHP